MIMTTHLFSILVWNYQFVYLGYRVKPFLINIRFALIIKRSLVSVCIKYYLRWGTKQIVNHGNNPTCRWIFDRLRERSKSTGPLINQLYSHFPRPPRSFVCSSYGYC